MECPDCGNCADFHSETILVCMKDGLSANSVEKYKPIGSLSADRCPGFYPGEPAYFTREDLSMAEAYARDIYGNLSERALYLGTREWVVLNSEFAT